MNTSAAGQVLIGVSKNLEQARGAQESKAASEYQPTCIKARVEWVNQPCSQKSHMT